MSSKAMDLPNPGSHWWVVLIQGIAAIILGILLLVNPASTVVVLVWFLGIYWLVTGVISLVSLLWNRSHWGWKLFTGILGIIAGLFILQYPLASALVVPTSVALVLGLLGIFMGISQLIQAFRGGGWGLGVLGVLSIILGLLLITRPLVAGLALAFVLGILLILGGILAIFASFSLRRLGKEFEEAQARASQMAAQASSTASGIASRAAGTVSGVAGAATAGVAGVTAAGVAATRQAAADVKTGAAGVVDTATDVASDAGRAVGDAASTVASGVAGVAAAGVDVTQQAGEKVAGAVEALFTGNVDPFDAEEMAKYKYPLEFIEGVGPAYAEKLKAIGIANCLDLIKAGYTPKGRAELAEKSGIAGSLILEWVNHVDLYRIKGVGSEYADLLEASGVDTVVELAQRNPANLTNAMLTVNTEKALVRKLPTQSQVEDWVAQAKGLPRVVTY